ncbi:sterol carrier family protein [Embleya sp. NBC_00896]|uniref:maleylpyruvate isomerase family mycothiol-dependent enzyme n=1 Tax=Embleya sp. NBC_00896 TaxID=2975961 RepID=UPI003865AFC6|nr:maleylpyruvate isomerase family mycothiol-dependent enzyme [Embleya sp. NBC_00896]
MTSKPAAPRPRKVDPVKVRAALIAEWRAMVEVTARLTPAQLAAPSGLTGWSTANLVGHMAASVEAVPRWLGLPIPTDPPITVERWANGTSAHAAAISDAADEMAEAGRTPADYVDAAIAALEAVEDTRVTATRIGPMRVADMLVTRLVEGVVHSDDLERATGEPFPHDRVALGTVVRALTDALAARAPGHAVEVRVPPFSVVQCVTGPRHTRGVPPNVVETDPKTWIRLATGRLTWADAVDNGQVLASGERSDLSANLPLMG